MQDHFHHHRKFFWTELTEYRVLTISFTAAPPPLWQGLVWRLNIYLLNKWMNGCSMSFQHSLCTWIASHIGNSVFPSSWVTFVKLYFSGRLPIFFWVFRSIGIKLFMIFSYNLNITSTLYLRPSFHFEHHLLVHSFFLTTPAIKCAFLLIFSKKFWQLIISYLFCFINFLLHLFFINLIHRPSLDLLCSLSNFLNWTHLFSIFFLNITPLNLHILIWKNCC